MQADFLVSLGHLSEIKYCQQSMVFACFKLNQKFTGLSSRLFKDWLNQGSRPFLGDEVADAPLKEDIQGWVVDIVLWIEGFISLEIEGRMCPKPAEGL